MNKAETLGPPGNSAFSPAGFPGCRHAQRRSQHQHGSLQLMWAAVCGHFKTSAHGATTSNCSCIWWQPPESQSGYALSHSDIWVRETTSPHSPNDWSRSGKSPGSFLGKFYQWTPPEPRQVQQPQTGVPMTLQEPEPRPPTTRSGRGHRGRVPSLDETKVSSVIRTRFPHTGVLSDSPGPSQLSSPAFLLHPHPAVCKASPVPFRPVWSSRC